MPLESDLDCDLQFNKWPNGIQEIYSFFLFSESENSKIEIQTSQRYWRGNFRFIL